jgi:hypothetical protein
MNGTDRIYVDSIGQMGIGRSAPRFDLDINGNQRIQSTSNFIKSTLSLYANPYLAIDPGGYGSAYISFSNFNNLGGGNYDFTSKYKIVFEGGTSERLKIYNVDNDDQLVLTSGGNIGMGLATPSEKLHVIGSQVLQDLEPMLKLKTTSVSAAGAKADIEFNGSSSNLASIRYTNSSLILSGRSGTFNDMVLKSGNVGINVASPIEKLHVSGNALISNNGSLFLAKTSGLRTVEIKSTESGADGSSILLYNDAGLVTIEMDADFGDGDGRVITSELQIRGGSDLSENFDINDAKELKPGMLVSIDTEKEGMLCITNQANDKKIVGVISGANGIKPGMLMGQQGSIANGKHPVALAGRVYVLSNNEGGEINAGDFLTSSSQRGYAKKANKLDDAQGAIIGKAMGKADSKTGYVLVLINLQ